MNVIEDPAQFGQRLVELPTEILSMIFESVPKPHLKALRASCRAFEDSTRDHLFHTVSLAPRKRQLRIFKQVTSHPILRSKVRHLSYDLSMYSDSLLLESSKKSYIEELVRQLDGRKLEKNVEKISWKYFKKLALDERKIIEANEEAKLLTKYLVNLQGLEEVSISYRYTGPYRCWTVASPIAPSSDPSHSKRGSGERMGCALLFLFRAIRDAQLPIRIFHYRLNNQHLLLEDIPKRQVTQYRTLFANLTTINLDLNKLSYGKAKGQLFRASVDPVQLGLADLLGYARNLQHLKVERRCNAKYWEGPLGNDEPHSGAILHLPSLQSLEFDGMVCRADDLVAFMMAHASSLRKVSFFETMLSQGSWKDVCDALAVLNLTQLRLRELKYTGSWKFLTRKYYFNEEWELDGVEAKILEGTYDDDNDPWSKSENPEHEAS